MWHFTTAVVVLGTLFVSPSAAQFTKRNRTMATRACRPEFMSMPWCDVSKSVGEGCVHSACTAHRSKLPAVLLINMRLCLRWRVSVAVRLMLSANKIVSQSHASVLMDCVWFHEIASLSAKNTCTIHFDLQLQIAGKNWFV